MKPTRKQLEEIVQSHIIAKYQNIEIGKIVVDDLIAAGVEVELETKTIGEVWFNKIFFMDGGGYVGITNQSKDESSRSFKADYHVFNKMVSPWLDALAAEVRADERRRWPDQNELSKIVSVVLDSADARTSRCEQATAAAILRRVNDGKL